VKRKWEVRRSLVLRLDAQRRWDIAYQRLLQWTNKVAGVSEEDTNLNPTQEVKDENCPLCPRFDFAATTKSDD